MKSLLYIYPLRRYVAVICLYIISFIPALYTAFIAHPVAGKPRLDWDGSLFQHGGWYMTQGAVLYRDIFDVKPPFAFETTALLSWLSFGDMFILHILSVGFSALAALGILLLIEHFIYIETQSILASMSAVIFLLAFQTFRDAPAYGFSPKHFSLFFGLLSIQLKQKYPFWAGACAAASAGYWQMGLLFCLLVLPNRHAVIGGMVVAAAIVLPILLQGAGKQMVKQAVFSHFLIKEDLSVTDRVWKLLPFLTFHWLLLPLAFYGICKAPVWVKAGTAWYAVQILFFDLDAGGDVMSPLLFLAIGFGMSRPPKWMLWVAIVMMMISIIKPPKLPGISESLASDPTRNGLPSLAYIYWEQYQPETCHYRLSGMEIQWIEKFGEGCK